MKKIKFIYIVALFAVSLIFLQSCENSIVGDLPYEEKLVIKCIMEADMPVTDIFIGRTLPPMYTENYYGDLPQDAIVNDAVGYISDSEKNYTLESIGNSMYKAVDFVPKEGVTYKLHVSWNGHTATGETFIPSKPEILSARVVNRGKDYVEQVAFIKFKGQRNASYIGSSFSDIYSYYNYGSPVFIRNNSSSDTAEVEIYNISDYEQNKYMSMQLISFPPEFIEFYNSKNMGGESPSGIFSTSGINVKWNIQGEAIGLFLGQRTLEFKLEDLLIKQ